MSSHPTDRLIRELLQTRRAATDEEVAAIVERLATAPFDPREVPVPTRFRGKSYVGQVLSSRASARFLHLFQRVVEDGEWAMGTTETDYESDLRAAIRHPAARLALYERRGGRIASVLAPNNLAPARLGPTPKPWIFVVYAADRGTIVTGHQVLAFPTHRVPENVLWLH